MRVSADRISHLGKFYHSSPVHRVCHLQSSAHAAAAVQANGGDLGRPATCEERSKKSELKNGGRTMTACWKTLVMGIALVGTLLIEAGESQAFHHRHRGGGGCGCGGYSSCSSGCGTSSTSYSSGCSTCGSYSTSYTAPSSCGCNAIDSGSYSSGGSSGYSSGSSQGYSQPSSRGMSSPSGSGSHESNPPPPPPSSQGPGGPNASGGPTGGESSVMIQSGPPALPERSSSGSDSASH